MFCQLVKWTISSAIDERRALPWLARAHIAKCEVCREFYLDSVRLSSRLSSDAQAFKDAPPFLVESERSPRPAPKLRRLSALAGGFLAILIVAGGVLFISSPSKSQREAAATASMEGLHAAKADLESLPSLFESISVPSFDMDQELKNFTDDAKSAFKFVIDSARL